jgi:hypothetical protein
MKSYLLFFLSIVAIKEVEEGIGREMLFFILHDGLSCCNFQSSSIVAIERSCYP